MSITKRLILWLVVLVSVLWLATALITRSVFVEEIDEMRHEAIRNAALRMMPIVLHSLKGPERTNPADGTLDEDASFLVAGIKGAMAFIVRDRTGKTILRSYDAKDVKFPDTVRPGLLVGDNVLAYTVNDARSGYALTLVEPNTHRREALAEATAALFLPMLLLVPLMVGLIWYLTRLATLPIRDLRRRITLRTFSDKTLLELDTAAVELRPIARAADQLIARLETSLEDERRFSSNVAHELRTPIAGALAQAQRLRLEIGEDGPTERVDAIETALRKLSQLTEKLLQAARIESTPQLQHLREDLSPALDLVLRDVAAGEPADSRIVLENRLGQDLIVAMDADIFAIALRNLVENAIRHGDPETPVTVAIEKDWTVHVINGGPPLDGDSLEKLKSRFTRGGNTTEGHGIGLSIVDRLMKQSGGGLTLHSPAQGKSDGFEAVLHLP